jgi:hypothetical protein
MFIKSSYVTVSIISGLATVALSSPSQAALINFRSWNEVGDIAAPSLGKVDLSSNARNNDDSPAPDSNFYFSNNPAVDVQTLESNLGLTSGSLDPDPDNFIVALEGSGVQQQYIFTQKTSFSFDWTFLTNEQSPFDFNDYAFVAINGQIQNLASASNSVALIPPSTNYSREVLGSYTQIFNPGTYSIALGGVDVNSFDQTSALRISNASIETVSEPSSIFGLLVFFGLGIFFSRTQLIEHK